MICVEFNPTIPNDVVFVQARSDAVRNGSSLAALVELASTNGYTLVETTLFNAFFVKTDLFEAHLRSQVPIMDTSIEALHETTMGTQLYQLYDGTLKLTGCQKLLWHRRRIEESEIQVIPPEARAFPFEPPDQLPRAGPTASEAAAAAAKASAVDLSAYAQPTSAASAPSRITRSECGERLWRALSTDGLAFIRGTGVPRECCARAIATAQAFFDPATPETARESALAKDRARRGYSRTGTENFAALVGAAAPNDSVRKFRMGNDGQHGPEHQPNAWPSAGAWAPAAAAEFKAALEAYYAAACDVGRAVLAALADELAAKSTTGTSSGLVKLIQAEATPGSAQTSILTLLGYTPKRKKRRKGELRPLVAAHTDVGVSCSVLPQQICRHRCTVALADGYPGRCHIVDRQAYKELHKGIFQI